MKKEELEKLSQKFLSQFEKIKVFLFDVDGILTDGRVFYDGSEVGFNRHFYVPDGYGIKVLRNAGFKVGVLSGGDSLGVRNRFELLGVDYLLLGNEDKRYAFEKIAEAGFAPENLLYMGDELFDIPVLEIAGFSATVSHAPWEVKEVVDYVCDKEAGRGAVREVIDIFRYARKIRPVIEKVTPV